MFVERDLQGITASTGVTSAVFSGVPAQSQVTEGIFVKEYPIVKGTQTRILINIAFFIRAFNLQVKCFKAWKFALNTLHIALY